MNFIIKQIIIVVSVVIIGILFLSSITIIEPYEVGIQTTLGYINPKDIEPGFHLINPISDVNKVNVRLRVITVGKEDAATKDLQSVYTTLTLSYSISRSSAFNLYKNVGLDIDNKLLLPTINQTFKGVVSKFNSQELITNREEVSNQIRNELSTELTHYGLTINTISITNFRFTPEFEKSIEQKVVAQQFMEQQSIQLQTVKIIAQQVVEKAKGEAQAIEIQKNAIDGTNGDSYLRLKTIDKWDGKLPLYNSNSNLTPMINLSK